VLETLYPWTKFANFYFFCVGLLQCWKAVSLTNGQPSSYSTLSFIILCEMFFKGKEDLRRHRGDRATNQEQVEVLPAESDSGFVKRAWADVRVGDIVRVKSRETFPADLLLLRGSDPPGQCWVNTKPLDGETDTKLRLVPKQLVALLEAPAACEPSALRSALRGATLRCEQPNDKVNDITAQLCLEGRPPTLVSEDNFLLRGCQLRNTEWVFGLVATTGVQTKIQYLPGAEHVGIPQPWHVKLMAGFKAAVGGGTGVKPKIGRMMKMVNLDIIAVVLWLILICLLGGILYSCWEYALPRGALWYLEDDTEPGLLVFIKMTARFFLICYQFVPISLYVSMMFFQTLCRVFLANEIECYDASQDEPCQVRQMSLLDELGQVSHIFSDKTGTLTSNHMEFRRCFVLGATTGVAYGCGETAISKSLRERRAAETRPVAPAMRADSGSSVATYEGLAPPTASEANELRISSAPLPPFAGCKEASSTYCNFEEAEGASSIFSVLKSSDESGKMCRELMLAMAINHSVLLEKVNDRVELSASSPDEQAFVAAAEFFGFDFERRDADRGLLTIRDKQSGLAHEVELLYAFPYESSRKRMSVIVRLPPALLEVVGGGAAVRLYTKGADSVLCDLESGVLEPGSRGSDEASMRTLDQLLYDWADIALRTLVFAKRELPDFESWRTKYDVAIADPENVRKLKLHEDNEISTLQAQVESGLTLQGATAIEDKLQGGVPEILADLRTAGIKVWMLTGDKVGTAKNIATACNILPTDADTLEVTCETFPVLAELKTSSLLVASRALEVAKRAAGRRSIKGSNGVPRPPEASWCSWFADLLMPHRRAGREEAAERGSAHYLDALRHHTELLDGEYPELTQVRAALRDRQVKMQHAYASGGGGGGGGGVGNSDAGGDAKDMCLVLDEKAIEYCGLVCADVLREVGHGSRSVVACRARKDQKAQLLTLIKTGYPESCCLAIGDGANDVAMIKAGHIGVGIIGKEGMQAVNNSDFAIGQFRFLRHLLFVHGRFAYRRTALFCYYMFYKNVANVLAMYFYTLSALASGERLFVQMYIEVYNIVFTSLPIILFCVFDQDVEKQVAAFTPKLYTPGIMRTCYTHLGFAVWMAEAVFLAVLVTYIPALALGYPGWSLSSPQNGDPGFASVSMVAMTLVVLGVNLRLAIELHSWHGLEHFFMWGSIASIELCCLLFSFVWCPDWWPTSLNWNLLHDIVWHVWDDFSYWLACILVITLSLAPRTLGKAWDVFFVNRVHRRISRITVRHRDRCRRRSCLCPLPQS
jgi:magnesium-transporting ATPase (P-type)